MGSLSLFLNTFFNQPDPVGFVLGKHSKGYGWGGLGAASGASSGIDKISLRELFEFDKWKGTSAYAQDMTLTKQILMNVQKNAVSGILGMVGLRVANNLVTKLGVSRNFNKGVRAIGMGNLVKM